VSQSAGRPRSKFHSNKLGHDPLLHSSSGSTSDCSDSNGNGWVPRGVSPGKANGGVRSENDEDQGCRSVGRYRSLAAAGPRSKLGSQATGLEAGCRPHRPSPPGKCHPEHTKTATSQCRPASAKRAPRLDPGFTPALPTRGDWMDLSHVVLHRQFCHVQSRPASSASSTSVIGPHCRPAARG
jgi:hypothetical protein